MVAPQSVTPIRPARRGARRPKALRGLRVTLLLAAGAAISAGCGDEVSRDADPLCGAVSSSLSSDAVRLARPADSEPLFRPIRERRHSLRGRPRDTVSGFREIRLFEREITLESGALRHVEAVPADLNLIFEPVLVFAPRVRVVGEDDWTELGWVRVEKTRHGDRSVYEVPFTLPPDLVGEAGDEGEETAGPRAIEIGLSAHASSSRASHAWESRPVSIREGAVLAASLGAIPSGDRQGDVAWRVMACEGDRCTCLHAEVQGAARVAREGWQERRIALDRLAGQVASIRLETEVLDESSDPLDPGLWAEPVLFERAAAGSTPPPNLLLVSLDTLGADHLGTYGYPRDTSPFIDDVLAPRGAVFLNALAPATTTGPSHMTLFTSLPPSVHGAVSNLGGRSLPEAVPTLAETLRGAGYVTAAVTENGAITQAMGFGRGFDHYEENRSARMIRPEGHIEATLGAGRELIERARGLPWFVFVQTYQVHYPYSPPPEYRTLFADDGLDAPGADQLFSGGRSDFHPRLYDQEIRYTDDQLRAFLGGLEAAGLLDNTVVVVLSDHGEAFFEHTYLGHGADLHRETVRVPLLISGPGVPAGLRVEPRVGLADVMPTVLELLSVPIPDDNLGRSLVPLLGAEATAAGASERPIFSEAWQTTGVTRRGGVKLDQPTLAIEHGDHKLIRYKTDAGPRHSLFDLSVDPNEQTDLLAGRRSPPADVVRRFEALSTLLDDYASETQRRAAALGVEPDVAPEAEIDPERLEKLRALGYVE